MYTTNRNSKNKINGVKNNMNNNKLNEVLENLKKICNDSQNIAQVILALENDYKKIILDGVDPLYFVKNFKCVGEITDAFGEEDNEESRVIVSLAVYDRGEKEDGTMNYAILGVFAGYNDVKTVYAYEERDN